MYFTRMKYLQVGHHFVKNSTLHRVTARTQRSIHYYVVNRNTYQNGSNMIQGVKQISGLNNSELVLFIDINEIPIYFDGALLPITKQYFNKY